MSEADLLSIASVVQQAYQALEFPAGSQPDWRLFEEVFVEVAVLGLRVFPQDPAVSVMTLREYAAAQMRNNLSEQGYSETPGQRLTEVIGDVAVVRQSFTMNFADAAVAAVDVFCLVRTASGWRIVSVVSDTR